MELLWHVTQRLWSRLLAVLVCAAQETPPLPGRDAEHSKTYRLRQNVRTVVLDVSAVDRSGRSVAGLKAGEFQVTEDGAPQRISFFHGQISTRCCH
jgi:hypothetical protein